MENIYDVIVIGSGVAGMTSSLYLKRLNLKVLLIEKEAPGGQINKTSSVENYPGFIQISGPDLAFSIYEQIKKINVEMKSAKVLNIKLEENLKIVETNKGSYKTKTIIIATGREPKPLELDNEQELIGKGISYCSLCDGPFFKGKDVVVVGGGDSALEESIYLATICSSVTIINRRDKLRATDYFINKIKNIDNIKVKYNSVITTLKHENGYLTGIIINETEEIMTSGLFIYVGSEPNIEFLSELNINNDKNYILVDDKMETNIDGIYAVGDAIKKDLYQITTAVGDGALAATSLHSKYFL